MLDTSGDINSMWRNATPLTMAAAHAGHFKVARLLLKHGADPNAGVSLLHTSCDWHLQHLLEGLDFLHGHGWCVDNADEKGQTALHKAAFLGYAQAVRKLLSFGAERNRRSRLGAKIGCHCAAGVTRFSVYSLCLNLCQSLHAAACLLHSHPG
jgi:serine/threonine-protein phosphatase 6 regulatory ankyrin repeat subunit B